MQVPAALQPSDSVLFPSFNENHVLSTLCHDEVATLRRRPKLLVFGQLFCKRALHIT